MAAGLPQLRREGSADLNANTGTCVHTRRACWCAQPEACSAHRHACTGTHMRAHTLCPHKDRSQPQAKRSGLPEGEGATVTWWESREDTWVTGTSGEVDLGGAWGSRPRLPTLSCCHHIRERTLQSLLGRKKGGNPSGTCSCLSPLLLELK